MIARCPSCLERYDEGAMCADCKDDPRKPQEPTVVPHTPSAYQEGVIETDGRGLGRGLADFR